MSAPVTKSNSISTEAAADRKIINSVYAISFTLLLIPLVLVGRAYFFSGNKEDFMNSCTNTQPLIQGDRTKEPVNINRIKQLKIDICENLVWKNDVSSNISWAWNLFFIVLPVASTIILAVEDNSKLKAVFVAITSASTILISRTAVDQWYEFQNILATEGRALVFRLNYQVNTSQELEEVIKQYQDLILRSSVGQPSIKLTPSPSVSPASTK
jgi:hypothetical protein